MALSISISTERRQPFKLAFHSDSQAAKMIPEEYLGFRIYLYLGIYVI